MRASGVLKHRSPNSAPAAAAATSFKIAHVMAMLPLSMTAWRFTGTLPKKKYLPPPIPLLIAVGYDTSECTLRTISDRRKHITALGFEYT